MNYWNATAKYLQGNEAPVCTNCGQKMFPTDDHGNFTCTCDLGECTNVVTGTVYPSSPLPQIDASGMTDDEKEKIPASNRLNDTPTKGEVEELNKMLDIWGPLA